MKPLKFNSGKKYLTAPQQKKITEFCNSGFNCGDAVVDGDKTISLYMFKYPIGAKTPQTDIIGYDDDGTEYYMTPLATEKDAKDVVVHIGVTENDKTTYEIITGSEWMKLVNKHDKVEKSKEKELSNESQSMLNSHKTMHKNGQYNEPVDFTSKENLEKDAPLIDIKDESGLDADS